MAKDRLAARRRSSAARVAMLGSVTLATAILAGVLPASSQALRTDANGAWDQARLAGPPVAAVAAVSATPVQVHLKLKLDGRRLYVALSGPGSRKVRVTYMAVYRGHQLASGEKVVALVNGHRTVSFTISEHVAKYATLRAKASFTSK